MEDFLRKYGWLLTLALIAIGATLAAIGVNNILASKLAPYTVPELPEIQEQPQKKTPAKQLTGLRQWDGEIAGRCLFGCKDQEEEATCEGGCEKGETCEEGVCVPVEEEDSAPRDSSIPVESDAPLKLLGTMSADNTRYSMALIMDEDTSQTHVVTPDDYIGDDILIVDVRRDRVIFERQGQLEFIRMANSISGNPTPVSVTPQISPNPSRPTVSLGNKQVKADDGGEKGIEKDGEGNYKVERESIKKRLKNPEELSSQGRIIPNYKDGQRSGLKIVGVRPDSIYRDLGIQSGDVLRGVNGNEINSQQEALELFEKLKTEDEVEVQVERRGQQKQLKFNIQ